MTFTKAPPPSNLTGELHARIRSLQAQLAEYQGRTEYMRVGYARYEHVRKMTARQFSDLYGKNLAGVASFDDLIDRSMAGAR